MVHLSTTFPTQQSTKYLDMPITQRMRRWHACATTTGYQDLALECDIPDGNYIDFLDTLAEDPIEPNEDDMETVYVNNGNEVIDDSINHSCRK